MDVLTEETADTRSAGNRTPPHSTLIEVPHFSHFSFNFAHASSPVRGNPECLGRS